MRSLEVLIEKDAFSAAQPMEVTADTPLSSLVPLLVDKLQLPQTDLFGQRLHYQLRQSAGAVLPENATLEKAGIASGARLSLEVLADGERDMPQTQRGSGSLILPPSRSAAELYTSDTLGDEAGFAPIKAGSTRKHTRRSVLLLGGLASMVLLGGGISYANMHGWLSGTQGTGMQSSGKGAGMMKGSPVPSPTVQQAMVPTQARALTDFTRHQGTVRVARWSPDGKMIASGADDANVYLWDRNGMAGNALKHQASVRALAWSPDGQRLVTGAGTQVTFFDSGNKTILGHSMRAHTNRITSLDWSNQGARQVVSGGMDRRALIWDTTTYRSLRLFTRHTTAIYAVSWDAGGNLVASSSQGGVTRVWQASNTSEIHGLLMDGEHSMRATAFAPVGMRLACAGSDGVVRIWDGAVCQRQGNGQFGLQCMDTPMRIQVTKTSLRSLTWSPNGRFLAVGADDGTLAFLYPERSQKPLFMVKRNAPVLSVSWNSDGKHVVSVSGRSATIWELS
ncbi:EsaB/YukD family protein [Ktedonospora formicarum]|uniref:Anaphase-promoting complex subunit 4-like WD40 domain-containing protein n=1 Tax=Ktedonospora formicarum TaxID=2778364 RepID=A0A8J3HW12_9CHLR|nr:EsaB/YukD family protein [Ktedonospora formicarum]GHO43051.1 hypothetical protein KSX_12140 [Ktedonospora formicarum]